MTKVETDIPKDYLNGDATLLYSAQKLRQRHALMRKTYIDDGLNTTFK